MGDNGLLGNVTFALTCSVLYTSSYLMKMATLLIYILNTILLLWHDRCENIFQVYIDNYESATEPGFPGWLSIPSEGCDPGWSIEVSDFFPSVSEIWFLRVQTYRTKYGIGLLFQESLQWQCHCTVARGSAIVLLIYGFLLMFNSNIWPNMAPSQDMCSNYELHWIWPFKVTQGQIQWCN